MDTASTGATTNMTERKILFLCAETYPPLYEFLDKVFNDCLSSLGYEAVWVMPETGSKTIEEKTWGNNKVVVFPKVRPESMGNLLSVYARHIQFIRQATNLALNAYGPFWLLQVRDDPAMAFVACRIGSQFSLPWAYQLSHLKEEEFIMYGKMGFYGSRLKNMLQGAVGLVIRNMLLYRAPLIFPISVQMKRRLARYGVPERAMVPVEEGVDCSVEPRQLDRPAERIRQEMGLGKRPVIIYVGTMSRFRRLEFLLKSFCYVVARNPDACLLMVGEGRTPDDTTWLKGQAARLGLGAQVVFTGHVSREQVMGFIRAADVGVSPIPINFVYTNSSPIKVLEYLGLEVPVVGTKVPDQKRVIEESRGGICTKWDANEFGRAINTLIDLPPEGRRAMGRRGRAWVKKNRDFPLLARKISEAYKGLAGRWSKGHRLLV